MQVMHGRDPFVFSKLPKSLREPQLGEQEEACKIRVAKTLYCTHTLTFTAMLTHSAFL
jgi:hypothetical protein